MIILFDNHVQERLNRIEEVEGIPQNEFVRQAVSAWATPNTAGRWRCRS